MAGIGFSLKRLFDKKGILNLCRAYGYAGIITAGPMILGVVLLLGMSLVCRMGGMSTDDRELLNCMFTYGLLVSLTITSLFNMTLTRYVSDKLYEGKNEKVLPSFWGAISIEVVLCFILYGVFLLFANIDLLQGLLCLWFSLTLIVVWTEMIYMTALKDYKSIVLSFTISLMLGFILALIFILIGFVTIETMLFSVIVAYGLLAARYLTIMLGYFDRSEGSYFSFLRWFDKYRSLAFSGAFVNIGLFSHLIIMYFGPLRVQVKGLFYGAPQYDVPALMAFFSLLITTIGFVTSVEVKFFPKYSNYYGLFNDKGAIKDIQLAEREMRTILSREMSYLGHKQLFTTIIFIIVVPPILQLIMPGITPLALSIFRFLCVGYGTYALANSMMLILLYFEDYVGALIGTLLFAVFSSAVTIVQILYGSKEFFGLGFFAGTIVFYVFVCLRLSWYSRRLPYYLLSRQSIIYVEEKGPLAAISKALDKRQERIKQEREAELSERIEMEMKQEGLKL